MLGLMDSGQGGASEEANMAAASKALQMVEDTIRGPDSKIDKLEGEIDELKREIRAAEETGEKEVLVVLRQEMVELRKEKNILLERSSPAERGISLSGQLTDLKKDLTEVKGTLSTILTQQEQQPESFSRVGSSVAQGVLQELHVKEVNGNELYPIDPNAGVECPSFNLSEYHSENEGTPHLMRHHEQQLRRCGLYFGRDGYAMYDVRDQRSCLQFKSSSRIYKGTTDCTLAPYGLLGASCATCMRVGFEHKQSHKQTATAVAGPPQLVSYSARNKGQSIAVALGALACASWPMFVDLTDGELHHLLALRGDKLVVWQGLTPSQAYNKIAQDLGAEPVLASIDAELDQVPDEGDEALRQFKRIRSTIQVTSVLREQLDSILPFLSGPDKYRAAFEIIASHVSAAGSQDDGDAGEEKYLHMFS